MALPRNWQLGLQAHAPRLTWLLTVNVLGLEPTGEPHLALRAGSERYASDTDVRLTVADRDPVPFWPHLTELPEVTTTLALQDRRVEVTEATCAVSSAAGLGDLLAGRGGGQRATARLDLALTDRMNLSEVLLMSAGKVTGPPRIDRRLGNVSFSITDGDPDNTAPFDPAGIPITLLSFPDAPAESIGQPRRVIMGPFPNELRCPWVSANICYLGEPVGKVGPTRFFADGTPISAAPRVAALPDATGKFQFWGLVFDDPPRRQDGSLPWITASGGVGQSDINPVIFLLEIVGGMRLSPDARASLQQSPVDFSLLFYRSGANVLELVRDQILPQTELVLGFFHGQVQIYRLLAEDTPTMALGVGTGLRYRLPVQGAETNVSRVWNRFQVNCGRNLAGATETSLLSIVRDKDHGAAAIKALLAQSERDYGPQTLEPVEALDLAVATDERGVRTCPSGERLADLMAYLYARPGRPHQYRAEWLEGLSIDLNTRVLLTDPSERLSRHETRLVQKTISLDSGVTLRCLSFDEPVLPAVFPPRRRG